MTSLSSSSNMTKPADMGSIAFSRTRRARARARAGGGAARAAVADDRPVFLAEQDEAVGHGRDRVLEAPARPRPLAFGALPLAQRRQQRQGERGQQQRGPGGRDRDR